MRQTKFYLTIALIFSSMGLAVSVNQTVPDKEITLKTEDGRSTNLKSLLDSKVGTAVVFVATKCPISNKYNTRYNELAEALKKKGVNFVPVNSNVTESLDDVKSHAQEHKFTFAVYKDDGSKTADLLDANH